MKRFKVVTIVGTRPELIKLSRVIAELDQQVEHVLVHTGQNYNYELNEIFFKELEIRSPDRFLHAADPNLLARSIGNIIAYSDAVLAEERPDALLILGDTNSCLSAYPAKRRQIPVFHMEAGNRCFDDRVPEEINRRLIDHISDINMPYTEHAREYLLREGLDPDFIIKTGSPMREVLLFYQNKISDSTVLERLNLEPEKYFLISLHREENVDSEVNFQGFLRLVEELAEKFGFPIIVSTHPRTRKNLEEMARPRSFNKLIHFLKPFGFPDYIKLQQNAYCVFSDSGTITEESAILGFPAINIRDAHERPEGMDEGVLIMCSLRSEKIFQSLDVVRKQIESSKTGGYPFKIPADYSSINVSKKVVRIILSYIDYVNRKVWYKKKS